jgi:hypothetical protein
VYQWSQLVPVEVANTDKAEVAVHYHIKYPQV